MNLEDIKEGQIYTYYPKAQNIGDNLHFPVLVDEITKSGRVRVKVQGNKKSMVVFAKRLSDQRDLFEKG